MFTEEITAARQRRDEASEVAKATKAASDAACRDFRAMLLAHLRERGIPADLTPISQSDFNAIYSTVSHELGRVRGQINAAEYYAAEYHSGKRASDLTAVRTEWADLKAWAQPVLDEVYRRARPAAGTV